MTWLAVSIQGDSIKSLRSDAESAVAGGAELIELRLDLCAGVSDADIRRLCESLPEAVGIILTIRSSNEGGAFRGTESERAEHLNALRSVGHYVDLELAAWRSSSQLHHDIVGVPQAADISSSADGNAPSAPGGRRLILSRHDPQSRPPTLQAEIVAMLDEPACSVPKLAWRARSVRDNFEAFELMRESPRAAIVICMGACGLMSRILAKKFGAFATFASAAEGRETAPGQISVAEMKTRYRWDAINHETRIYGLIGDPVAHSLSPAVHNAVLAEAGLNAVYLPMPVAPGYESFKAFMVEWLARPWLDLCGVSVTTPHKEHALAFIHEQGGFADATAERIGAVNTIWLADGKLHGSNTDCAAALAAVREALGLSEETSLGGLRVAILGAGGVARAIVAGLTDAGARVTVYNRTVEKAANLARTMGCEARAWDARHQTRAQLLVNCTTVGMWPNTEESPLPADSVPEGCTVFDTVYNPLRTRLLRDASRRRCHVIDGLSMFIRQAEEQSRVWTGDVASPGVMREAAERAIGVLPSA